MRKKERNGPGIATFADSGDPTLASSDDKESEGAVPRTAGAKHEPTERVAARMVARRMRNLAHRFAGKSVKKSVRTFKISSPKRNRERTGQLSRRERRFGPKRNRSEERRVGKECRSRWSPYH